MTRVARRVLGDLALIHCRRFEAAIAAGREEEAAFEIALAGMIYDVVEALG